MDENTGKVSHWQDFPKYKKSFCYQDVMYGFAGANRVYILFLYNMQKLSVDERKSEDVNLLNWVAQVAKDEKLDFMMMRYDGTLQVFGYLADFDALYDSSSGGLTVEQHGIGSGSQSQVYKDNKSSPCPRSPIQAIIDKNELALKQLERKVRRRGAAIESISIDEKITECQEMGSDPFTGGGIVMTKHISQDKIFAEQLSVLSSIDGVAAMNNTYAFCSLDPTVEKAKLDKLGFKPNQKSSLDTVTEKKDTLIYQMVSDDFASMKHKQQTKSSAKKLNV